MPDIALFMIAGAGLMAYGGWRFACAWRLRRDGVSAEGRVVRITSDEGGGFPVVEFTADGATHQFTSRSSLGLFSSVELGAIVPMRYSETKPAKAVIDRPRDAFKGPAGLITLGFYLATVWYVPYFELLP